MKKPGHYLLLILLFPLLAAACGGSESAAPAQGQGPALIMFYTDN
jgi:hypothetical protein